MASPPPVAGPMTGPVWQLGFVVNDLERSLRDWSNHTGTGHWFIYTYSPETIPLLEYDGHRADISYKLAMSQTLVPQIELIQSLRGPSVYDPWISTHDPGLHHIAYRVTSLDESLRQMGELGYPPIQIGSGYGISGDGGFAYFDLRPSLGLFVELIQVPVQRRSPEAVWTGSDLYLPQSVV